MKHHAQKHDPRGLHERAISAALMLVESRQSHSPMLPEIARILDEPETRLQGLFPDDRALLIASVEQALIMLIDTCTRAVVRVDPDDPVAQFAALGDSYLDWADRYPVQFKMLQDCPFLDAQNVPALRRYTDALADLMVRMLTRARDGGRLHPKEDIPMLVLSSRCYVTGVARMVIDGRMRDWVPGRDPLSVAKDLTRDFVRRIARSSHLLLADAP